MNRRDIFIRVLSGMIILVALASIIAYFVISKDKPWLAFFVACCGGLIALNLVFSLILVLRNFKKK